MSDDGMWVHCTREELAGGLVQGGADTFAHYLGGECKCGVDHGGNSRKGRSSMKNADIVATYDYKDEKGQLLFQAVRLSPKGFSQRRPNGVGGWEWNLKGVRTVPYRLPDLLAALSRHDPVFIVEGEKDCDYLCDFGLTATCNPMGAGKWNNAWNYMFFGAKVVIIPDNDGPGIDHANSVARGIYPRANEVRIVPLPGLGEGGDVSDWLRLGTTSIAQLVEIVRQTEPFFTPSKAPAWGYTVGP
ncbi:MAG: hypothetical protein ACR2M4_12480 [Actinomycetota bacterium]